MTAKIWFPLIIHLSFVFLTKTSDHFLPACEEINLGSLRFIIQPALTAPLFYYSLLVLSTGAFFYLLYKFRILQIRRTEQVRNEISRNLHDEVGAALTNISLQAFLAKNQLNDPTALKEILDRIQSDSQHVSESIREIIWSINPAIDTAGEAFPMMLRFASEVLEAKNIELKAELGQGFEDVKFSMQQRRDIYLIFKECINNIARHSEADKVNIRFLHNSKNIEMMISDNGKGFDPMNLLMNNGLKNMNQRAIRQRWKLSIESKLMKGTRLSLKMQKA